MGALDSLDLSGMTVTKRKRTVLDEVIKELVETLDISEYCDSGVFVNCDGVTAILHFPATGGGRITITARLQDAEEAEAEDQA